MSADDILDACENGHMPPTVALMHLIGASQSEDAFAHNIARARARPAGSLRNLCALADRNPHCWRLAQDMLATVNHDDLGSVERVAAMFDAAVALSPAASVALYSLGDEQALDLATQEIISLLHAQGLVDARTDVLDLGCGIGRFTRALAGEVRHVTGLDVSPRMIAEAERRCADLSNVQLCVTSGRDLALIADESQDLVLAVDVFPYLVQVDLELAATHIREAARVLRPGGALLILNFSYRGDIARDREDLRNLIAGLPLRAAKLAPTPLAHWDATTFLLRKQA